ncbi:BON domain-containing protein [Nucisporomicrobium flavum]|jgi:osmotically-inducible protein OsmY|uniref:BON domain-containing protein n=1 Tax=Nucisporomicrobium flavum TaxID=2785915 RepID=UPI0018F57CD4|nr:BON domain-containing protein [Nucisporomicrobium flavum]
MYSWWYPDWYNGQSYVGRSRPDGEPEAGRDVTDPQKRLARAVAEALFDDAAVTGGQFDLSVQNGVVILDGEADTEASRSAAVARAWSVPGVRDVCNALAVKKRRR